MYEELKKEIQRQMTENIVPGVLNVFTAHIEFDKERPSVEDIHHLFSDFSWYRCMLTKGQDRVHIDKHDKEAIHVHYPYATGLSIIIFTHENHKYLRN